jgi:hypothetical protein
MSAAYYLLGFVVLPMWIASGLIDYFCHRAGRISANAGTPESLLHLLQFSLVGLPVTLALFLKANSGFFLFAAIVILLHHLVAYVDVRYADTVRKIKPFEQGVHSFLELLPITAFLLLAVAAWPQFCALLGLGREKAVFMPELQMLFPAYSVAILAGAFLFNFLPYVEELVRCWRAAHNQG